ncbi:MAG: hypothetical protein V1904_06790 [Bacteroidota bacterium]
MKFPKLLFICIILTLHLFSISAKSQIRFSVNYGLDFYQHFTNPEVEGDTTLRTSGNAIANIIIGPKFYIGFRNFSVSGEAEVNWGITALCLKEFKGVGVLSFPLLAKLNFGGLSGLIENIGDFGVSIGGGVQYSMTEIYGLTSEFNNITKRDLFKVYVGEIQIGYRAESGVASFYVRYGKGENNSSLFHIGYTVSYIFPTGDSRRSHSGIFRPSRKH